MTKDNVKFLNASSQYINDLLEEFKSGVVSGVITNFVIAAIKKENEKVTIVSIPNTDRLPEICLAIDITKAYLLDWACQNMGELSSEDTSAYFAEDEKDDKE